MLLQQSSFPGTILPTMRKRGVVQGLDPVPTLLTVPQGETETFPLRWLSWWYQETGWKVECGSRGPPLASGAALTCKLLG